MRPIISARARSIFFKPGLISQIFKPGSETVPYSGTKTNVAVNVYITMLYGVSLWAFYKDYSTIKRSNYRRIADKQQRPAFLTDIERDIHDAPNRLFHSEEEDEQQERGNFWRTAHSLTFADVSIFCAGWGFLIQLCNVGLAVQGRRSIVYRGGLVGALTFPGLAYLIWRQRMHKMEYQGVQIY